VPIPPHGWIRSSHCDSNDVCSEEAAVGLGAER
jgi:hypothetical protein